ncbi:D-glycero-beta-D-manno-heptose-1,7-bisphosphate 7-phosphatase [Terasakiispira papahanaumokuakeensis]|uniref:D,D-heptose 1,7-bisphosphate phosphatase n=1 Tax=Terasakiispira papahanaumokuakeensis TaxID=197479 RepID=A0A1E2VCQ7_9GAMM|nr:D-glycero-beta-D-manno-heptose 1,7-bisphosphate 7-phosphatase [Terasakiispira papahanaumokuakeensis]ODC04761.1 D-glycero-beta-D-manno-heptose-1,7-bisphosphate 7-phosphatase [Terasakiispira papahanaumokuakeensis]
MPDLDPHRKLLILDRDGVINQDSDVFVKSADEWIPIPGSIDALARLSQAGWTLAIATNQSGLARGKFSSADLTAMHDKMIHLVEQAGGHIDHIAFCPHGPDDHCDCRKPLPGLLEQIRTGLSLDDLEGAIMVGDALRDLQAGQAMGCQAVLVRTGKGEKTLAAGEGLTQVAVVDDLASLANLLLAPATPQALRA